MFLTEAEFTIKCGILLNIGDVMGVQGPYNTSYTNRLLLYNKLLLNIIKKPLCTKINKYRTIVHQVKCICPGRYQSGAEQCYL